MLNTLQKSKVTIQNMNDYRCKQEVHGGWGPVLYWLALFSVYFFCLRILTHIISTDHMTIT